MPLNDPVPSNAPDVLLRNAQDFDKLINATGYHENRVGNSLPSYIQAIAELGFDAPVLFAAGIVVDSSRKTVEYSGARYFALPSSVPFTTTATFNPAQWQMFDQQFAGAEIAQIGTYSLLRAYAGAATLVYVAGRLNYQDGAQGFFVKTNRVGATDNDGTVIVSSIGDVWERHGIASVKAFGGTWDGIANDSAAWNAACNSGVKVIDARGVNSLISSEVNIQSGLTLLMSGADIKFVGDSINGFYANQKSDFNILGAFNITGDLVSAPPLTVTAAAIKIVDCKNYRIESPTISKIRGHGVYTSGGAGISARSEHGVIDKPRVFECVWGITDDAGSGAEYCTIINPHVTQCLEYGVKTAAGNVTWLGGHIVDNLKDGVRVTNGSNHAHGIFSAVNINHNVRYNIFASQVINGQSFADCHIYANGNTGAGAIYLDRCKGITFDGGHLDCWVYNDKDGSSGQNVVRNMYCPGSYGEAKLRSTNSGLDQLYITGCTGSGAYSDGLTINDKSPASAAVSRNTTIALTSGVSTNLILPVVNANKFGNINPSTGIYTVPTGQAGWYRISALCVFGGTGLNQSASYVELLKNGSSVALMLTSAFSASKLTADANIDLYLNAGDTINLKASITGTSPVFGDSVSVSMLNIDRVA